MKSTYDHKNKPLYISIRKSHNDLFTEIVRYKRDNAFLTKLVNHYSNYFQQLTITNDKANQTHLLSISDSFTRLQKAAAYKDDYTGLQISRIAHFSALVAKSIGMNMEFCNLIKLASPVYDVGEIGIPDSILKKPGALTVSEWNIMRKHTIYGADILSQLDDPVIKMAKQIALCHHEKWDGSGYPNGLKDEQIPMSARIVAIVDVFDALTTDKCYRPALPDFLALSIIEDGRGTHFCPFVTDKFLAISDEIIKLRNIINKVSL